MKTKTIAYISRSPSDYSNRVAQGIVRYISQQPHFNLQVLRKQGFMPLWQSHEFEGDGVIGMFVNEDAIKQFRKKGIPVINVSASTDEISPWVSIDNSHIGVLAADYFLQKAYTQFAFIDTPVVVLYSKLRRNGFVQRIESAGQKVTSLNLSYSITHTPDDWNAGLKEVVEQLLILPKNTAIFCGHDIVARLVSQACEEIGLNIPEDIAILGVDNEELLCSACRVSLSSMEQGEDRVGYIAAQMLDQILQGKAVEDKVIIPPIGVVERRSTECSAVSDVPLARALDFMRKNLHTQVDFNNVSKVAGISRRVLELRMKGLIGRTPAVELQRMRIERARQLLLGSELPLEEIATQCGFRRRERLHEAFKKQTSHTPAFYRRTFGSQ